jgi:hypothetical protein
MSDVVHPEKKVVIMTEKQIEAQTKRLEAQKRKEAEFKAAREEKTQKRLGEIEEYLDGKLGKRPNASGSARRWRMLRDLAKHIAYLGVTDFDQLRCWVAPNLQCMKDRTLRDDYLTYLADLEIISYNPNNHVIAWKGALK